MICIDYKTYCYFYEFENASSFLDFVDLGENKDSYLSFIRDILDEN
jgi:hypothetical protein